MCSTSTSTACGPRCSKTDDVTLPFFAPFARRSDGSIAVRLVPEERDALRRLVDDLRELLVAAPPHRNPAMRRLHPVVHRDDADAEEEWARLMHGELLEARFQALDEVERTLSADAITADELTLWMQSCNALRLALGVRLGVEDDDEYGDTDDELDPDELDEPDDPEAYARMLYNWLGSLVFAAVEVLSGELGPALDSDDA